MLTNFAIFSPDVRHTYHQRISAVTGLICQGGSADTLIVITLAELRTNPSARAALWDAHFGAGGEATEQKHSWYNSINEMVDQHYPYSTAQSGLGNEELVIRTNLKSNDLHSILSTIKSGRDENIPISGYGVTLGLFPIETSTLPSTIHASTNSPARLLPGIPGAMSTFGSRIVS